MEVDFFFFAGKSRMCVIILLALICRPIPKRSVHDVRIVRMYVPEQVREDCHVPCTCQKCFGLLGALAVLKNIVSFSTKGFRGICMSALRVLYNTVLSWCPEN